MVDYFLHREMSFQHQFCVYTVDRLRMVISVRTRFKVSKLLG
jgi:hypothetical protein